MPQIITQSKRPIRPETTQKMTVNRGKEISFKKYLEMGVARGTFGDTPERDFACDAMADKKFRDFTDWEYLEAYLLFNGAIPAAVAAAKKLFRQWKAGL